MSLKFPVDAKLKEDLSDQVVLADEWDVEGLNKQHCLFDGRRQA